MRSTGLISACIVVALLPAVAEGSPTVKGLSANDSDEQTDLYTDTGNANLLYVTPPRMGSIEVTQQSLVVDEPTCKSVAAVNATRLSELATRELITRQIFDVEQSRTSIIEEGIKNKIDPAEIQRDVAAWDPILQASHDRLAALDAVSAEVVMPANLVRSAGYYGFVATAPWGDAVTSAMDANPNLTVNRIPTKDVKVFVSILDADGFTPNELIANVNTGNIADLASVVDGIQIDVEPTKVGACFIKYPQIMGAEAAAYSFGVAINYTHQMAVTTTVRAVYNLKDVYTYFVKTGKSGGFFSRKSWSEVREDRNVDELFKLEIEFEQDVDEAAKEAERIRVREYMMGYAVADMVARMVPAGDPGKSGAGIAAETLTKTCGFNAYCAGAAAGLTILDGIFGKSRNTSSLTQVLDVTRTYDSRVTEAIDIPGSISFVYRP